MRVLVTGAAGFLGGPIVRAATLAGHDVVALVRRTVVRESDHLVGATVVVGDLRQPASIAPTLADIDVVIHAAAAAGGERGVQLANTVVATERLLAALDSCPPRRFVLVSSFSVYDYESLRSGDVLDETCAIDPFPRRRDPYTETKIVQERLVTEWCAARGVPCVVVRPGMIVGPGKVWKAGAAIALGPFALVVAPRSRMHLVGVDDCAEAIVAAAAVTLPGCTTVNVVADDLPTYGQYFRLCRKLGIERRRLVPVPWTVAAGVAGTLRLVDKMLLGQRLRTPELLDSRRARARWLPLSYPNRRARTVLAWRSSTPIAEVLERAVHEGHD